MEDTTSRLIDASTHSTLGQYSLECHRVDDAEHVRMKFHGLEVEHYQCRACGDGFIAETGKPACPDCNETEAIQTYTEYVTEQLAAVFKEQLPQILAEQISPLLDRLDRLLDRQIPIEELRELAEQARLGLATDLRPAKIQ